MIKIFQEELIYMPSYYYIGHFSKFIKPGAIQMSSSGTNKLLYVSFANPDQSQVIVIQNETEAPQNINIKGLKEEIKLTIEAHSISTIVI